MTGGRARIVGAYEHPGRRLPEHTLPQLFREITAGVLADAGLGVEDIDGLISSNVPGGAVGLAETLGLNNLRYSEMTDLGGASYISHAGHAARAIEMNRARAVLVIMAGLPSQGISLRVPPGPAEAYEAAHGSTLVAQYALVARRHMYEHGTTSEDLAEIKTAASYHASFNPNALLPTEVTVDEVLASPFIAEPLHRLDSCVTTDGGGAFVIVSEGLARDLGSRGPALVAQEEAFMHSSNGRYDLTTAPAAKTGPRALESAGIGIGDIDYASIYDSFTITALVNLESLGFFEPGSGRSILREGGLRAPHGRVPINTDGGGLSNNHPGMRGGMIRMIEAVRQLRGDAHPSLQIQDCEFALVHGSGHSLGSRSSAATAILQRGDA